MAFIPLRFWHLRLILLHLHLRHLLTGIVEIIIIWEVTVVLASHLQFLSVFTAEIKMKRYTRIRLFDHRVLAVFLVFDIFYYLLELPRFGILVARISLTVNTFFFREEFGKVSKSIFCLRLLGFNLNILLNLWLHLSQIRCFWLLFRI